MDEPRRDCFYYLRYAGRDYCKKPWYEGRVIDPPDEAACENCSARITERPIVIEIAEALEEAT